MNWRRWLKHGRSTKGSKVECCCRDFDEPVFLLLPSDGRFCAIRGRFRQLFDQRPERSWRRLLSCRNRQLPWADGRTDGCCPSWVFPVCSTKHWRREQCHWAAARLQVFCVC